MRKLGVLMAAVAVGSAIAGLAIVAPVGHAAAGRELRFFTHDTQQAQLDLGDKGDSTGDRYIFSGDVYDHHGGTKLGRVGGTCDTISRASSGQGEDVCTVYLDLDLGRGQLMIGFIGDHGAFLGGSPLPISIAGGTGVYRDAHGDGTVTVLNATDTDTIIRLD
jgi:hypothetical protein